MTRPEARATFSDLYYRLGRHRETLARRVQSYDAAAAVHDDARAAMVASGIILLIDQLAGTADAMRDARRGAFPTGAERESSRAPLTPRARRSKSARRPGRASR
jgi:hypothetical protein